MTQQDKSFMGQFAAAKKQVAELRTMMKDSARFAVLSYPSKSTGENDRSEFKKISKA